MAILQFDNFDNPDSFLIGSVFQQLDIWKEKKLGLDTDILRE